MKIKTNGSFLFEHNKLSDEKNVVTKSFVKMQAQFVLSIQNMNECTLDGRLIG